MKRIEEVLYHEKLSFTDEESIEREIDDAKEDGLNYIRYTVNIETVTISWDENNEYTVENTSSRDKHTILKIYAISEATGESPYKVSSKGETYIDSFVWYENMTMEDIIKEQIKNGADLSYEELREEFEHGYINSTSLGYVEKLQ